MTPCGVLNLDKPAGSTSRQTLDVLKRLVRPAKTGHAGTLDPLATGVLIACVGSATRLIEYVQRMPKAYRATFLFGCTSPTEDVEGEVVQLRDPPHPTRDEITAAALRFVGRTEQRPPAFSALKLAGRRAYDLARRGDAVELAARPIDVYRIAVIAYEYPELVLDVECGSGTYIRSLGRDLAESLGTAAVMSALRRTSIGNFRVADAVDPKKLTPENWTAFLQPALHAVDYLPRVMLSPTEATRIRNGLTIERAEVGGRRADGEEVVGWVERSEPHRWSAVGRQTESGGRKADTEERKAESGERSDEGEEFSRVPEERGALPSDSFSRVRHGRDPAQEQLQEFAAVDETGQLVAILIPHGRDQLCPSRNL